MRKVVALFAVLSIASVLAACESSQDKNARLAKIAERNIKAAAAGLTLGRPDARIEVVGKAVVAGPSSTAVVVTVRNRSSQNVRDLPIGIKTYGPKGGDPTYSNTGPGYGADLNHLSLIRPGQTVDWVNDQLPPGAINRLTVRIGTGRSAIDPPPDPKLTKLQWWKDPASGWAYKGRVAASGKVVQQRLIIYGTIRSGGRVIAAGRAAVDNLPPGGKPKLVAIYPLGAGLGSDRMTVSAPPVSF